ncbi:MAG TPA: hypothetical protein VK712_00400, partial [Verrucomicrobiae bacterium]|nr:hypothetical protein [Verrucomicrobiae bacterium]
IEHIVDNLQSRFFATSENAVGNETENMLSTYVKSYVLPALTKCHGTSIDKSCNPVFGTSSNPVTALYTGWSNARLENKLASDYGIEFRAVKHGAVYKYYMKAPGIKNPNGDDITAFASDNKDLFQEVSRGSVRQTVRSALENETQWKQVMYRYKVGRLLEEKYGIKRCIIFCGTQDALQDFANQKKNAAQIFLTQRVIVPRTQSLGIVMECLLDPSCDPESTEPTTPEDGTTGELEGAPENAATDTAVRTNLEQLAQTYGITDDATVSQMIQDYTDISEKGYQQYALDAVLEKLGLSEFSENISDSVPVIGWINTGAQLISGVNRVGPSVKKLSYVVNASAAVSMYMMYRTFADEIHTGHVDPTEVGSMVSSLGPGNPGNSTDPEVGGTASAESAPIYNSVINDSGSSSTPTSMLDNILPTKAYADASTDTTDASNNFVCKDGKPIPAGKLVCPEEVLGQGNNALDSIHSFLNLPGINVITAAATAISRVGSILGGLIGDVLNLIPGFSDIGQLISQVLNPVFSSITNDLIPNPFGSNMSGGSKVTMMAGGAAVAGKDSCEQIGCESVSPVAYMNIVNQQQSVAQQQFDSQPLFARMFNTDSQYSLVSKLALDMPTDIGGSMESGFASILSDPFGAIAHGFGSLLPDKQASATTPVTASSADPFNIGLTAFPDNQIPVNGEAYWSAHNCGDTSSSGPIAQWQQAAANDPTDPNTGMPVHTTVEPCLLIEDSVGDAGGLFDTSLLSSDDLADLNGSSSGSGSNTPTPTTTTLNVQAAQQAAQEANTGNVKVGFALYDSTGNQLGKYNETSQNYGASITKSMLLVAYLKQVGSGSISSEAKSELTNMIENSDNASADWVYAHLNNGSSDVKAVASAAGMSGFHFDTSDPVYVLGQSQITADDFAKFFSKIDTYMPSSQKDFGMNLLASLSSADQNGLLQAGLPGIVYSKEGWKPESSGLGAPYVVNQAAQFASGGTTYGVAVTVGGTSDQSSGEAIVKNVVSALIGPGGQ